MGERRQSSVIGARLRAAREAAGKSLAWTARQTNYSKAALGHAENGVRRPSPDLITWYERLFGATATDPVTSLSTLGKGDVDRRSFLRRATYSAALSATALALTPEIGRIAAIDDTRIVGMGEVNALRQVTDAFQRLDEHRGGGVGRTAIAEFLATDVADLLRSRFATAEVRSQALSAAAELAYLAGFKAHDANHDGMAQRYYLAALELAEESQVPGHDGWIFRILALQGADLGNRTFSVQLAEEAVRRTRGRVDGATQALFSVALARCHAETGDRARAHDALRTTEPWITADRGDQLPAWCAWWGGDKATVNSQAAKTLRALNEWGAAESHHLLATTFWDPNAHRRVYGRTWADVGLARWENGDHGGAVAAWEIAVPILQPLQSTRADAALTKISKRAPQLVKA
ncbi:helix-turn-helix domain-containing protein (plasmid) [Nocardia sp. NBC_01377]|uniref:helix-turn-helix domain-containing protein n=1 Tax=Nocardia sp. NBC_01377 TaxID=2903595 RepID=UPI002F90E58A